MIRNYIKIAWRNLTFNKSFPLAQSHLFRDSEQREKSKWRIGISMLWQRKNE